MDAPCADDERQTVDCRGVADGDAACDRECDDGRTLTDDGECVYLVGGDGEDEESEPSNKRGGCPDADIACDDAQTLTDDFACVGLI